MTLKRPGWKNREGRTMQGFEGKDIKVELEGSPVERLKEMVV